MNDIVKKASGEVCLSPEIAREIIWLTSMSKGMEERLKEIKKGLYEEMEAKGIIKITADTEEGNLTISYIAPTEAESLNTKALRDDLPDVYNAYIEMKKKAGSIRVMVK